MDINLKIKDKYACQIENIENVISKFIGIGQYLYV